MDQPVWWALLLKPFIGIVFVAFLLFGSNFIARLIYAVMPRGKVRDYLFQGWKGGRTARRTDAEQRVLNDPPLLNRESGKDSTRL